ncbi:hypothetical protein HanPSC8_Chr13g0562721 [Helianthus annuus]|nr:hypothetical protein HanPSC8_Chr13g0562721 [Helianthus annuus]
MLRTISTKLCALRLLRFMICNLTLLYGIKMLEGAHGRREGMGPMTGTVTTTITSMELHLADILEMLHIDLSPIGLYLHMIPFVVTDDY